MNRVDVIEGIEITIEGTTIATEGYSEVLTFTLTNEEIEILEQDVNEFIAQIIKPYCEKLLKYSSCRMTKIDWYGVVTPKYEVYHKTIWAD